VILNEATITEISCFLYEVIRYLSHLGGGIDKPPRKFLILNNPCYNTSMLDLIEGIKHGDRHAIREFYCMFAPQISRFLQRKLPPEEAKEILNDVFLDAIDELPFLKNTENVKAWLYRIAHNKSVDYYRKRKIKSILLSEVPFLQIAAKEIQQPEFQYEKNRIREKIERTMEKLSEKYRNILRLHYENGKKVKEIAVVYNISPKACESLLYRARLEFMRRYKDAE